MYSRSKREPKPTSKFLNYCSSSSLPEKKTKAPLVSKSKVVDVEVQKKNVSLTESELDSSLNSCTGTELTKELDSSMMSSTSDIRRSSRKPKPSSKLDGFVSNIKQGKVASKIPVESRIRVQTNFIKVPKVIPVVKVEPLKRVATVEPLKREIRPVKRIGSSSGTLLKPTASSLARSRPITKPQTIPERSRPIKRPHTSPERPNKAPKLSRTHIRPSTTTRTVHKVFSKIPESSSHTKKESEEEMRSLELPKKENEEASKVEMKGTLEKFLVMGSKVAKAISETLENNEEELLCRSSAFERKCLDLVEALSSTGHDVASHDMNQVLRLLEEEQVERKTYRHAFLESLRVSHLTNMALYTQMLRLLKTL